MQARLSDIGDRSTPFLGSEWVNSGSSALGAAYADDPIQDQMFQNICIADRHLFSTLQLRILILD